MSLRRLKPCNAVRRERDDRRGTGRRVEPTRFGEVWPAVSLLATRSTEVAAASLSRISPWHRAAALAMSVLVAVPAQAIGSPQDHPRDGVVVDPCAPDYEPDDPTQAVPLPGDIDICALAVSRRRGAAELVLSTAEAPAAGRGRLYRVEWRVEGCVRQVWWPVLHPTGPRARAYDSCAEPSAAPQAAVVESRLVLSVPTRFAAELDRLGVKSYAAAVVPEVEGPAPALQTFHLTLCPCDVAGHPPH